MTIKILSPTWGHENWPINDFLKKIKEAGYDGVDTWIPDDPQDKKALLDGLQQYELVLVAHQHQAQGDSFEAFKSSFKKYLQICAEAQPLLINSHTGRDYFSFDQNLALIDIAQAFSEQTGIIVAHETHRGRLGSAPFTITEYFEARDNFLITADLSHWTCVSESMLEHFQPVVEEAIKRTRHLHARVGYEQGPQVPDPRAAEWNYALNTFFSWWDAIVAHNKQLGRDVFTITTEFGPPPYMPTMPYTRQPLADQFEVNCFMKNILTTRY